MDDQIKNMLDLIDKTIAQELEDAKEFLCFVEKYKKQYFVKAEKLPYHINLLDEIRVDENAHSRILARLLKRKTPHEKHEILESFVRYIKEKAKGKSVSFENIQINNPVTTTEKRRIDLWIRDNDYAIIIENKIHWAPDTNEQLSQYIKKTMKENFKEEQIYVIYLSSTYDKKPNDQTWGNYKEEFKDRFLHLSFREDILTWLTDSVLPNVRVKDKSLFSALQQYTEHLKEKFSLRNNIEIINMNMELQKIIKDDWKLTGSSQENLNNLEANKKILNNISNQVDALIKQEKMRRWKDKIPVWKDLLKTDYPNYIQKTECDAGVIIPKMSDKTETEIHIALISEDNGGAYCALNVYVNDEEILPEDIKARVKHLLPEDKDEDHHLLQWLTLDEYDAAYQLLRSSIEAIIAP